MDTIVVGSENAPGLMELWPSHRKPVLRRGGDDPHIRCWNGAKIRLRAAFSAERFRGPNNDGAVLDELDAWNPEKMSAAEAFALAEFSVRTGPDPRIFCAATPKRGRLVSKLRIRSDIHVTRGSLLDNLDNLSPTFAKAMLAQYVGTHLGDQEIHGEMPEQAEKAIVTAELIDENRVSSAPDLVRVVVGVDPYGGGGDACGIGASGKGVDGDGYVLADRTCRLGPEGWGRRVVETALEFDAEVIVVETNYGGNMCISTITAAASAMGVRLPRVKGIPHTKAKHIRFQPVGAMHERGELHHVGNHDELEGEIVMFTPESFEGDASPNRTDACCMSLIELFPQRPMRSVSESLDQWGAPNAEPA